MKTWTIDEMMLENPCPKYTKEVVTQLWTGREKLSLAEVLALEIPAADRMWAVWRPGAITKKQEAALLEKIAQAPAKEQEDLESQLAAIRQRRETMLPLLPANDALASVTIFGAGNIASKQALASWASGCGAGAIGCSMTGRMRGVWLFLDIVGLLCH